MSDLTEFLLARIAEDRSHALGWCEDGDGACPEWRTHPGHLSAARVLAECDAKRQIAADPEPQYRADYHGWHITKQSMLRYLAAVYSDHADYRPEWRP